jgi:phosphatidylserine decarboxylase
MKITRFGKKEVQEWAVILISAAVAAAFFCKLLMVLCLLLFVGVALFFRDPERTTPVGDNLIIAPADGKITAVDIVDENEYSGTTCRRVSIFLSVLDVHVNRAPYSGKVEYVKYTPGAFHNAMSFEKSEHNENNAIGIRTTGNEIKTLIRQITGLIARRIECGVKEGDTIVAGEDFGMLKFGSRTDLLIPQECCEIAVTVGDRVRAGETVLGVFTSKDAANA